MKNRYYTLILSAILILVFLIQNLFGITQYLVLNSKSNPQIWRYFTAIFLHADIIHLLYNLFALLMFGLILESLIGSKRFLLIFLSSGIAANLISVYFYDSSLGASGAIFGIIGCLIMIRPMLVVWVYGLPMPMFLAGAIWAAIDLFGLIIPSNVANLAHLVGLITGLIFGIFLREWRNINKEIKQEIRLDEGYIRKWEDYFLKG